MENWKNYIGYDWLDNIITGFLIAALSMGLGFWLQIRFYSLSLLWSYSNEFLSPVLKLSILSILPCCLIFNYFDKLYAFKGALFCLILSAILFFIKFL